MSPLQFLLSSLVLSLTSLSLLLASLLSSSIPLSDNELSIDTLFIFFLLTFDSIDFVLLLDLHLGLFKGLGAKNVEHRFNFGVEIKQIWVTLLNLSFFAVTRFGHFRMEHGYWRPVHIELSGVTSLLLWGLVSKNFFVLHGLNCRMHSSWDRLRRRDVSVWINVPRFLCQAWLSTLE